MISPDVPASAGMSGTALVRRILFIVWAGGAAFTAYFSMYAFRKPFTAVTYASVGDWSFAIDFKIALVVAQVAGYALSKFIGVKIVSEIDRRHRAVSILCLIALSWFALILFAVLPGPWKPVALFLNGLPLGMIWGLVFGYLEGRRVSDVLGAILCASFIVSSGMVKSVGVWLVTTLAVPEVWMPAATGAVFFPLLLLSVTGLAYLPPPDAADIAARVERCPMDSHARHRFLAAYWPGLTMLVIAYMMFTLIRDVRDNFAAEIWRELGYEGVSSVFTITELPIAVLTLLLLGALVMIRDNMRALVIVNGIVLLGAALVIASTACFQADMISPIAWMIASGAGLYFSYTPFNAMLFDRLLAASGRVGTAGFLIYVADAAGYFGSVLLLLIRNFSTFSLNWLSFFISLAYVGAGLSLVCIFFSMRYFLRTFEQKRF